MNDPVARKHYWAKTSACKGRGMRSGHEQSHLRKVIAAYSVTQVAE